MKFIIDAQLPRVLADYLRDKGHDVIHTLDLPLKNKTPDSQINRISLVERRIVISKDSDFYDRFFQKLEPYKLLYLTTGNITNEALLKLFDANLDRILAPLETYFVVELNTNSVITID